MNTKLALTYALITLLPAGKEFASGEKVQGRKPNILIILADDLGYGDVQCYNPRHGKIPTPNIDRLALQGMSFTDCHSSSGVSSPSRYTLLTGRYHWRTRLQSGIVNVFGEPLIAPDRLTIADLAKQNGYITTCIGKWHLGWDWPIEEEQRRFVHIPGNLSNNDTITNIEYQNAWSDIFSKPISCGPVEAGFDSYFGTDVPNWPPYCFIENDHTIGIPSELLPAENLGNNLASLPGPALKDWKLENILPSLGDRAVNFIIEAAKRPEPFLLYLPLTSPHTPLAVNSAWRGKSGLNTYADLVMETDAIVGSVLNALEKTGEVENTMVIFTSDNGCAHYIGAAELETLGHFPSGPFRGYKSDAWEGGHRIPFIVRWPEIIKPASTCDQLILHADIMATLADILGEELPDNTGEDSYSLFPLLKGKNKPVRENSVNCSIKGIPSIRYGQWKLILDSGSGGWTSGGGNYPVQLYNLAEDPGETKNLASELPERVAGMKMMLKKIINEGRSTHGQIQKNDVEVRIFPDQLN